MVSELQQEVEMSRDREVSAHEQLVCVVSKAERAIAEKNSFTKIVCYGWSTHVHRATLKVS